MFNSDVEAIQWFADKWNLPQKHVLGLVNAVREVPLKDESSFQAAVIRYCRANGIKVATRAEVERGTDV